MKYISLLAILFFGFNTTVYSQFDLQSESAKGTILKISEGDVLIYGGNYYGTEIDLEITVKSLNQEVVFDYEMMNERNNKGTLKISGKALEFARAQNNYYHEGGFKDLENQTSIWMSDLVFNELIETGEVTISTDQGASQVVLQNSNIGHDYSLTIAGEEIKDMSYVYSESKDGKVKYWISLDADNPVVLRMEMGWSIWLKEVRTK